MSILEGPRWRAANAELDRAWDLSGPERAAWLASLRARDPALADDVETLLDEHAALLAAGFLDKDTALQITRTGVPFGTPAAPDAPVIPDGATFGPYHIIRPLGHGGMGVVYEADEIESGRRVALKVLAGPRQDAKERERFEREGRLAASVNHPHCVFVFGASEIDGHPVIAMEVMRGTLADRLKIDGPLPPPVAVDAALQIVSGLQAAAAAGILHRDVKPSNCFLDADSVLKIGDFGISRSQRPSEETALSTRGRIAATPAYASPEQLRGGSLDMRSDIYSLGATLYELLTGRRPFDGADLMAVLMAVANDTPSAPHVHAPAVPPGLSAIVLRCLAKQPDDRFADYDVLAAALEPYAGTASTPAPFARRFIAGVIDAMILSLASVPIVFWMGVRSFTTGPLLLASAFEAAYFAVCEFRWGATPGKALCGLLVAQEGGAPLRGGQAVIRALAYVMLPSLPAVALSLVGAAIPESAQLMIGVGRVRPAEPLGRIMASPESLQFYASGFSLLVAALLFSTARRRNGYAAIHDLVSRTRVVERRVRTSRRAAAAITTEPQSEVVARVGPFAVLAGTIPGLPAGWRPGFDERLRRPVWIRELSAGTPPVSVARRSINRSTRLRWLAGRRDATQAWDAFEAAPGMPLEEAASRTRSWVEVRWWLLDLARECVAQSGDDRFQGRDRVWILQTGGAKLLDDPALDALAADSAPQLSVAAFLLDIVRAIRAPVDRTTARSLTPDPPWPLCVHAFLDQLAVAPDMSVGSIEQRLGLLAKQRPALTRRWRAWSLAGSLLLPTIWGLAALAVSLFGTVSAPITTNPPVARWQLGILVGVVSFAGALMAVGVLALVGAVIFRGGAAMRLSGLALVTSDGRPVSPLRALGRSALAWAPLLLLVVIFVAGIAAGDVSVRAGVAPQADASRGVDPRITLSSAHEAGVRAGRAMSGAGRRLRSGLMLWLTPASLVVMLAGAIVAVARPSRGIPDRLAGTWIVPQ